MKDKQKAVSFGLGLARQVLDSIDDEMAQQQEKQKRRKAPVSWVFLPLLGAGAAVGVMRKKAGKKVVPQQAVDMAIDVKNAATDLVKDKVLDNDQKPKAAPKKRTTRKKSTPKKSS